MIENSQIKNNYNLLFYYIVTLSCKLIVLPKKSLQCLFEYVYTGYVRNPPSQIWEPLTNRVRVGGNRNIEK